ncbi:MAG: tRNA glutamyl-Q(34) synthetase GluQRS [Pseudomonadales bacterium]|nr:tRNA glutamyl-Q(34) synthetase GluQRS [Pseudomonadales bacterium]
MPRSITPYRGRFAPSPTGPLHFGSLVAALGSYLDARQNKGAWLLRIENTDPPREQKGASALILKTLEAYHLFWDEAVLYQSQRQAIYEDHCQQLLSNDLAFYCSCSRSQLGGSGEIYPGYCRHHKTPHKSETAIRFKVTAESVCFQDQIQGPYCQHLHREVGDFIIKRKDKLYAYQLAVVCDDHLQGITHIVRGMDLLDNTPRQIALYHAFAYSAPIYSHLPLIVNNDGGKLSKQNLAEPISLTATRATLLYALAALKLQPPAELQTNSLDDILLWANNNWDKSKLSNIQHSICPTQIPQ